MSYIKEHQCPGSSSTPMRQAVAQQEAVDRWGAKRRFFLSMAEKEFIPCSWCGSEGLINHKQCQKCEGKGYENV